MFKNKARTDETTVRSDDVFSILEKPKKVVRETGKIDYSYSGGAIADVSFVTPVKGRMIPVFDSGFWEDKSPISKNIEKARPKLDLNLGINTVTKPRVSQNEISNVSIVPVSGGVVGSDNVVKSEISVLNISDLNVAVKPEVDILSLNIQTNAQNQEQRPRLDIGLGLSMDVFNLQRIDTRQSNVQVQKQELRLDTIQIQEYEQIYEPVSSEKTIKDRKQTTEEDEEVRKRRSDVFAPTGFIVLVKNRIYEHGKRVRPDSFRKLSSRPLSEADALSVGADYVGKHASATFKLVPVDGKPVALKKKVESFYNVAYQYDEKPDGRMVEKNTYRINSPGEINEISRLGWSAPHSKHKAQRVKGWI